MRIQGDIDVSVTMHYLDIEGLRTIDPYGARRTTEWHSLRARADVEDGEIKSIWLTGRGKYVKKDGTAGLQDSSMRFGHLGRLPQAWQTRITRDLNHLASHVAIQPVTDEPVAAEAPNVPHVGHGMVLTARSASRRRAEERSEDYASGGSLDVGEQR